MGFHKRRITKENVITIYERDGIEGLKTYFSADALIVEMDVDSSAIIEYLTNDDVSNIDKMVKSLKEKV